MHTHEEHENMPELPEVETVRRELEPWLTGRTVTGVHLRAPSGPKYANLERLPGQVINAVKRRGKYLILPLSGTDELIVHLGMTGVIAPALRSAKDEKHARVHLTLDAGVDPDLYFIDVRRFGRFLLTAAGDYRGMQTLQHLGPEPLGPDFTQAGFYRALQASAAEIKPYLLSQRPVAGLGNIYVDEALFMARIHPRTPANRISKNKTRSLHSAIVDVLDASVRAQGTTLADYRTVAGGTGEFVERLLAYGRAGEPCRRCGRNLARSVVGGRTTVFCSQCQRRVRVQ